MKITFALNELLTPRPVDSGPLLDLGLAPKKIDCTISTPGDFEFIGSGEEKEDLLHEVQVELAARLQVLIVMKRGLNLSQSEMDSVLQQCILDSYSVLKLSEASNLCQLNGLEKMPGAARYKGRVRYDVLFHAADQRRSSRIYLDTEEIVALSKRSPARFNTIDDFIKNSLVYLGLKVDDLPLNTQVNKVLPAIVDTLADLCIKGELTTGQLNSLPIVSEFRVGLG